MSATAAAAIAAAAYRLRLGGARFAGTLGPVRGNAAGASPELLDVREDAAGDDLRHVDWHGYARTGQLRVRRFEAEVAPWLDVVVDTSPSMAVTAAKADAARALVAATAVWARGLGAARRVVALGGGAIDGDALPLGDGAAVPAPPALPLRANGVRLLITDALWREPPAPVLHRLAAGASWFACVQLFDPWEADPVPGEALTLLDCETGDRREVALDARTVAGYRERLARLCDEVRGAVIGAGGRHARVLAADLASMCARSLLPAGVVEPA